jgi:DNA polymerase (family 10)
MTNAQIAAVFREIADRLDILGENPFRVRSYQKAARIVADLPAALADRVARDEPLTDIDGIGKSTAAKIVEMVHSGSCKMLTELRTKLPETLTELLAIESLGPKKVKLLYERVGVGSVEDLARAARDGKLEALPGFGARSVEKILAGIERYRRAAGRFLLSDGIAAAERVIGPLEGLRGVQRIDYAGSTRRRKETIGDVDVLAVCAEAPAVMECFVKMEDVEEVLAHGTTKSSVRLTDGLQVDLRVVAPEAYGAAMHYFTGSKEHNIAVRDRAKERGLKVNEYGVFQAKDERRVGGAEEADVFSAVGLPPIPPELREDRGEIQAAEAGKLPRLIEPGDIRGDLQMHTTESDGRHSIEQMARAAIEMGYQYIAITDHSKSTRVANGLDEKRLARHIQAIHKVDERLEGIRVLAGIEVDVMADGSLDLDDAVLADCDLVQASIHSGFAMSRQKMTDRICRALAHPLVHVLGHPTGRLLLRRDPYEVDIEKVIAEAVTHGVWLEINAYPDRLDLRDTHARAARDAGAKLTISTDAHSTEQLKLMKYGVWTARRAWLTKADVMNTRTAKQFLTALKKKRR